MAAPLLRNQIVSFYLENTEETPDDRIQEPHRSVPGFRRPPSGPGYTRVNSYDGLGGVLPEPPFQGRSDSEPARRETRTRSAPTTFNVMVICAILLNSLMMALEAIYIASPAMRQFSGIAEVGFTLFFVAEIVYRVWNTDPSPFFCGKEAWWNMFDIFVTLVGVLDAIADAFYGRIAHGLLAVRLFRIMRILRLFQAKLRDVDEVIVTAYSQILNFLVLMAVFLFIIAVFFTNLLWDADDPRVAACYSDLGTSIWTLFKLMTLDGWVRHVDMVMETNPSLLLFFGFFQFMSVAFVSIVPAIFIELHMAAKFAEDALRREQKAKRDQERAQSKASLPSYGDESPTDSLPVAIQTEDVASDSGESVLDRGGYGFDYASSDGEPFSLPVQRPYPTTPPNSPECRRREPQNQVGPLDFGELDGDMMGQQGLREEVALLRAEVLHLRSEFKEVLQEQKSQLRAFLQAMQQQAAASQTPQVAAVSTGIQCEPYTTSSSFAEDLLLFEAGPHETAAEAEVMEGPQVAVVTPRQDSQEAASSKSGEAFNEETRHLSALTDVEDTHVDAAPRLLQRAAEPTPEGSVLLADTFPNEELVLDNVSGAEKPEKEDRLGALSLEDNGQIEVFCSPTARRALSSDYGIQGAGTSGSGSAQSRRGRSVPARRSLRKANATERSARSRELQEGADLAA